MLVEAIATKPMGPAVTGPLAGNLPWSSLVQTLGHASKWLTSHQLPAGVCNYVLFGLVVSKYSSGKLVN